MQIMRKMKKVLALVAAMAMLVSMSLAVHAAQGPPDFPCPDCNNMVREWEEGEVMFYNISGRLVPMRHDNWGINLPPGETPELVREERIIAGPIPTGIVNNGLAVWSRVPGSMNQCPEWLVTWDTSHNPYNWSQRVADRRQWFWGAEQPADTWDRVWNAETQLDDLGNMVSVWVPTDIGFYHISWPDRFEYQYWEVEGAYRRYPGRYVFVCICEQPPVVCDECGEYPCECVDPPPPPVCDECGEYPCECGTPPPPPPVCDECGEYPCECETAPPPPCCECDCDCGCDECECGEPENGENGENGKAPQTGDTTSAATSAPLMIASVLALLTLSGGALLKRKK